MSSNVKKCSVCDSASIEHCLQCKSGTSGSHLDNEKKNREKKKNGRANGKIWCGKNKG